MAGHSKWSNIKARKGAQDKKRAKIFTRILKEITVAVRENGMNGDPESNPALRNAIQNARGVNMPKSNIDKAIKRASGADSKSYELMTFEGYAPHGIAVFVECMSDSLNRTVGIVRSIYTKYGGSLGTNGSLEFIFDRLGVFTILRDKLEMDWEDLQLELIEYGADVFEEEEEVYMIYCPFTKFGKVSEKLRELGVEPQSSELERVPNHTEVLEVEQALAVMKMIDAFEDEDDVQSVFHNLELTDELSEALQNQ